MATQVDAWSFGPDRDDLIDLLSETLNRVKSRLFSKAMEIARFACNGREPIPASVVEWRCLDALDDQMRTRLLSLYPF